MTAENGPETTTATRRPRRFLGYAAVALASVTSAVLPRFASEPHKDTRAPQNLYPIGGLERELRHRLGDQALLFRSLQRAAASVS